MWCDDSVLTEEPIPEQGSIRKACSKRGYTPQPPSRVDTTDRIRRLRIEMSKENSVEDKPLDAYLITSDDEHQVKIILVIYISFRTFIVLFLSIVCFILVIVIRSFRNKILYWAILNLE